MWRLELPAQPANTKPTQFTFKSLTGGDNVILSDVLFGDVHICSGQSNMQIAVGGVMNASQEIPAANAYPLVRVFTVGQTTNSTTPLRRTSASFCASLCASQIGIGIRSSVSSHA